MSSDDLREFLDGFRSTSLKSFERFNTLIYSPTGYMYVFTPGVRGWQDVPDLCDMLGEEARTAAQMVPGLEDAQITVEPYTLTNGAPALVRKVMPARRLPGQRDMPLQAVAAAN